MTIHGPEGFASGIKNMIHHKEWARAANEDFRRSLHPDTVVVLDDTTNHFYETMSNPKDLQELRMNVAANDNALDIQKAA